MYGGLFLTPFSTQSSNYAGDDNSRSNTRKGNNKDRHNNSNNRSLSGMSFAKKGGSIKSLRSDDSDGKKNLTKVETTQDDEILIKQSYIDDFISSYNKNRMNSQVVNELILDQFVDVCDIMTHYYDNKYSKIV